MGFTRVLESQRAGSTLHPDGLRWLESIDDRLHARVVRLGVAQPRLAADVVTLGSLRDRFDVTVRVKPGTAAAYKHGLNSLCDYFGRDRALPTITPLDADKWRQSLVVEKLAVATVSGPPLGQPGSSLGTASETPTCGPG